MTGRGGFAPPATPLITMLRQKMYKEYPPTPIGGNQASKNKLQSFSHPVKFIPSMVLESKILETGMVSGTPNKGSTTNGHVIAAWGPFVQGRVLGRLVRIMFAIF